MFLLVYQKLFSEILIKSLVNKAVNETAVLKFIGAIFCIFHVV